jgi:hypothetical protein
LRVSRVLADFGTGFPRRVESFAFMHIVAYGTTTTCSSSVWASCASAQTQAPLVRDSPRPRHAAEMGKSALGKMTGLIRLEEVQCYGLFAARERHRSEGIDNSGTESGGRPSGGSSAATRQLH